MLVLRKMSILKKRFEKDETVSKHKTCIQESADVFKAFSIVQDF